jgi:hypothetical protein
MKSRTMQTLLVLFSLVGVGAWMHPGLDGHFRSWADWLGTNTAATVPHFPE